MLIEVDTTSHSVDDGLWLLIDFLLHKVVKRSLHDLGNFHLKSLDRTDRGDSIIATETVDVELYGIKISDNEALDPIQNKPPSLM
jgi:hypothetical protein